MISDDAIRLRSYFIWERLGRPDGRSAEHWQQAQDELEAESEACLFAKDYCERRVMPRPPILRPPRRMTAARVPPDRWRAAPIAATQ